jgi:hypothetical protein
MSDANYRNNIYIEQGGSNAYLKTGATVYGESGATLNGAAGFSFYLDSTSIDAARMKYTLISLNTVNKWGTSGTNLSGTSIFSPAYGYHWLSASTGLSKISMTLPSARLGAILVINMSNCAGDANMSLFADSGGGIAGVTVLNDNSVVCSSLELSAAAIVKFVCEVENQWAIVEMNASVTTRAAA